MPRVLSIQAVEIRKYFLNIADIKSASDIYLPLYVLTWVEKKTKVKNKALKISLDKYLQTGVWSSVL